MKDRILTTMEDSRALTPVAVSLYRCRVCDAVFEETGTTVPRAKRFPSGDSREGYAHALRQCCQTNGGKMTDVTDVLVPPTVGHECQAQQWDGCVGVADFVGFRLRHAPPRTT